jgi:hypothetical protein
VKLEFQENGERFYLSPLSFPALTGKGFRSFKVCRLMFKINAEEEA